MVVLLFEADESTITETVNCIIIIIWMWEHECPANTQIKKW